MAQPTSPVVIAHRGACGYLPEHTFAAKALAYAMGADYLEQDIVATQDDELIVLHDAVLDRTTDVASRYPDRAREDGRFYARDFDLQEIRELQAHERVDEKGEPVFPQRYPLQTDGFRVHTFAEELSFIADLQRRIGRPVGIYPEIKHPAMHRDDGVDITRLVLNTLQQHGYSEHADDVYLQCFDAAELRRVRHDLGCRLKLVQLIDGENHQDSGDTLLSDAGLQRLAGTVDGIGPNIESLLENDRVAAAHAASLLVHPYTARKDALPEGFATFSDLLETLFDDLQVDGVFTDFPDLALQFRRETIGN